VIASPAIKLPRKMGFTEKQNGAQVLTLLDRLSETVLQSFFL
jgi:hypothetical protein